MNRITYSALSCSSCCASYSLVNLDLPSSANHESIEQGALCCPSCHIVVPVCRGFPLFDEARPYPSSSLLSWVTQLTEKWFVTKAAYRQFLETKAERGMFDLYAAFQPFNESIRAFYPFLQLLRDILEPGDIILDTWCRTGWSAELLAGLFPEQQIIAIWEGNSNVLGYRGFDYWLNSSSRLRNLDIIFTHPDHPLPLASDSIAFVHGLDSLHRYRHQSYIPEVLRVCRDDGPLIFPHIHLSNSEPEPFFERGCHQYHGRDWRKWLDELTDGTGRSAWVLPEVTLFEQKHPQPLADDCDTQHYNALVAIGPNEWTGKLLASGVEMTLSGGCRFVSNPLATVNLHTGRVEYGGSMAGKADELLDRHPCYRERLSVCGESISAQESLFCWLAGQGMTLREITAAMAIDPAVGVETARSLCQRELLHAAPVSLSMFQLQQFYGFGEILANTPECFPKVWEDAREHFIDRHLLHWLNDGSRLGFEDADFIVAGIRSGLEAFGVKAGSRMAVYSHHHPEATLVTWAAWMSGIAVVPIDPELAIEQAAHLLEVAGVDILFSDKENDFSRLQVHAILFDGDEVATKQSFSDWLEPFLDLPPLAVNVEPDCLATIIFTSGSTGQPKGVMLSQKALMASGFEMARHYSWHNEVLLSLGPLSMMSGLRNACVSPLISASTSLVPAMCTRRYPTAAWEQAVQAGATVITTVPAWLAMLLARPLATNSSTLKQLLLTGTPLAASLQQEGEARLGCSIGNYYGLTETGGICAGTTSGSMHTKETLGHPSVNALVQLVDGDGNLVKSGEVGQIRVRSNQLMSGYLNAPEATASILRDGWIWTGDQGVWSDEGNLVMIGRTDDAIKLRDGSLFYPRVLEKLLLATPGVLDAVVTLTGSPEKLTALMVCQSPLEDIRQCFMARHGVDKGICHFPEHWAQVETLPRNSNGKIKRNVLAELI